VQRLLAVLLVLIGLVGLGLGRLGETVWAPATETTATVDLADPGPAVVIDPGVLYVGGTEGEVVIEGASDVSVITASNSDIEAYLEGTHYTRVTGASDWTTLSTEDMNPEGEAEIKDPTSSDLWRSVDTSQSPATIDVHEFWAGENGENEQVYRALLIVTDGTEPGASKISITWPVDDKNEWVPFAYAGGATVAVIGLVLLVVSPGRRRDEELEDEILDEDEIEAGAEDEPATESLAATVDEPATEVLAATKEDGAIAALATGELEKPVWPLGDLGADPATDDTAADGADSSDGTDSIDEQEQGR